MKTSLLIAVTFALATAFGTTDANAVPKTKYGKFKNGVGNCIFSDSKLPIRKESTYKGIAKSFIAEKTPIVYVRCYHPESFKKLAKHGKLFNSIRDKKQFFKWYKMGGYGGEMLKNSYTRVTSKNENWDQSYYWFCKGKNCDLGKDMRKRLLFEYKLKAKRGKAKLPYKKKFCMQVLYSTADSYTSLVTKKLAIKNRPIAEGCFEYVLTKGE